MAREEKELNVVCAVLLNGRRITGQIHLRLVSKSG